MADSANSQRSSSISDYYDYEKEDLTQIPLYKLLKTHGLQQYAKELISRGFGYDIMKLNNLRQGELERLFTDINCMPGHKVKLLQLIRYIAQEIIPVLSENSIHFNAEKPSQPKLSLPKNNSQKTLQSSTTAHPYSQSSQQPASHPHQYYFQQ